MGSLNAKGRKALPSDSFALPGGGPKGSDAYPLTDQDHAVAALARVAANGTPAEKALVRAAVRKKFPDLTSSKGKGGSLTAAHNNNVDRRAGKTGGG